MTFTDPGSLAIALTLPAPPGFSLAATVESHGGAFLAPFRWDTAEATLLWPERLAPGRSILLEIREALDPAAVQVMAQGETRPDTAEIARTRFSDKGGSELVTASSGVQRRSDCLPPDLLLE